VSAFLEDIKASGLDKKVLLVITGEFGRTPTKIQAKGGRDHWPNTQSVLLAGGGIQGGRIVGQTDTVGGEPKERPVHVQEIFATMYRNIGIDVSDVKIDDLNGRPRFLVDENRQPIGELY